MPTTTATDGKTIHMQPLTTDLNGTVTELPFPPKYGGHTQSVLSEAGYNAAQLEELLTTGIVSCGTA